MPCLSLWIGTKFGTVTAFPLSFPESQESRELCLQTINIQNSSIYFLIYLIKNLFFILIDVYLFIKNRYCFSFKRKYS